MLSVKELTTLRELVAVERLHEAEDFPMPMLDSPLYLSKRIVSLNNKVIGFGTLRATTEVILILDKSQPRTRRAKVIDLLVEDLDSDLTDLGFNDTHVFLCGEEVEKTERLLQRKFGFVRASGTPLYRSIHRGQDG